MYHHNVEARSTEEIRVRHRSEAADEPLDETPDVESADDTGPPAEPRTPADG